MEGAEVWWLVHLRFGLHFCLLVCLAAAVAIDWRHMIIPDATTVPMMGLGLLGGLAFGRTWLLPVWFRDSSVAAAAEDLATQGAPGLGPLARALFAGEAVPGWVAEFPHLHGLAVAAAGFVVGGAVIWAIRTLGRLALGRGAMGFGDVTLMAAAGTVLGWQLTLVALALANIFAVAGVVLAAPFRRAGEIPFGPALAAGCLAALAGFDFFWPYAERFFAFGPLLLPLAVLMAGLLFVLLVLVRGVKRLLGFRDSPEWGFEGVWRPGDQLAHFAGEKSRSAAATAPVAAAGRNTRMRQRWMGRRR